MGKRELKSKEERFTEGILILKKLKELGVPRDNEGFVETEKTIRRCVEDGLAIEVKKINFYPFDREGYILLPSLAGIEPTFGLRLVNRQ